MTRIPFVRRTRFAVLLALAPLAGACDSADSLLAPEDAPSVVVGRVTSVAPSAVGPAAVSSASLAGIEVSVDGGTALDLTDETGTFRLEVTTNDGRIRLRFRRGSMDVRLELEGIPSNTMLHLEVSLQADGVSVLSSRSDDLGEFEGTPTLVSVEGEAPDRTLRVELAGEHGPVAVDIVEGGTLFESDGDITSFDDLLAALDRGDPNLEIEGDGERQDDGSVIAVSVKVETDDHGDDDDDGRGHDGLHEFEGVATFASIEGDAPGRTLRVELAGEHGSVTVDIVEGGTLFESLGDITSFDGLLAALDRVDLQVEIEGDGERREDGSVVAVSVKVETDGDDDDDQNEHAGLSEVEGVATFVSVEGVAPGRTLRVELTDALGSVAVDIVEGSTLFESLGDITSFDGLLAALDRVDLQVKVEGDGERQEDGSVVAVSVKVETDQIG